MSSLLLGVGPVTAEVTPASVLVTVTKLGSPLAGRTVQIDGGSSQLTDGSGRVLYSGLTPSSVHGFSVSTPGLESVSWVATNPAASGSGNFTNFGPLTVAGPGGQTALNVAVTDGVSPPPPPPPPP